jgi:hypothetical protein
MKTFVLSLAVAATAAVFAGGPVAAASNDNSWHRFNTDQSLPAAEHERLTCARGETVLLCQYDKVAVNGSNPDRAVGRFAGREATSTWVCPDWFPPDVCGHVLRVWDGHARYLPPGGTPFRVEQQMVVVRWHGERVMFQYWVGQFACPWFRSFAAAKAANPAAGFDCLVP